MGYRRSSSDLEWKKVKEEVALRDRGVCRLCRCLTPVEMMILRKNAGSLMDRVDPAHIIPVSENPYIMYEASNIITLNRYSHSNLDSFKDPIDGHSITKEEVDKWWDRILRTNRVQYAEFKRITQE